MLASIFNPSNEEAETDEFLEFISQMAHLIGEPKVPIRELTSEHKVGGSWRMTHDVVLCLLHSHTGTPVHLDLFKELEPPKNRDLFLINNWYFSKKTTMICLSTLKSRFHASLFFAGY